MTAVLSSLSDSELIERLEHLVRTESATTENIIRHLAEMDIRRLYAKLGYSSLFDYAVRGLGYSSSSAMRRIKAARAGARLPRVFDSLEGGTLSLAALEVCAELLVSDDGAEVLTGILGKSRAEAERVAAKYRPLESIKLKDRVELLGTGESVKRAQQEMFENPEGNSNYFRGGSETPTYRVAFAASAEFMEVLGQAQALMFGGKREDVLLEHVLREALECYLDKHSAQRRRERREALRARKKLNAKVDTGVPDKPKPPKPRTRHIPICVRDEVLERDGYQCSYVGANGVRCQCRDGLELDHIMPYACGGESTVENLRVLCSAHNLLAEVERFGAGFVQGKVERACASGGNAGINLSPP
jgi:5-methylcytosine-specific restriction endonuclease McrA